MVLIASIALLIGLQLRGWRGSVNADGISYIELAGRYANGDFGALANGYWSPLYPALLGVAFRIGGRPELELSGSALTRELGLVLAVNLAIAALATLIYARLLVELDECDSSHTSLGLRLARIAAAGSLWIWWLVRFSGVTTTTPDLLLGACLAAVLTELVIVIARPTTWGALRLGIALAVGFWAKAVFFLVIPIAAFAYMVLVPRAMRRRHAAFLIGSIVILSAPLVVVQSTAQGRFSFGETGRLNYAWYVNGVPRGATASEPSVESSAYRDRPAIVRMNAAPGLLLYAGESPGSFPYWYDPSRFESSARPETSLGDQWRTLQTNARWFRVVSGAFAFIVLLALAISIRRRRLSWSHAIALLPALALLALYALTHPEGRLAGSAIVCSLAMVVYWRGGPRAALSSRRTLFAEISVLWLVPLVVSMRLSHQDSLRQHPAAPRPGRELSQAGVAPGSRIALLASPYGHYWAHQLGLRITVAGELAENSPSPSGELLSRIVDEACRRGAPLAAVVWRGTRAAHSEDTIELAGGWLAWLPPRRCAAQKATPTTTASASST